MAIKIDFTAPAEGSGRSTDVVFVVHGRNDAARAAMFTFLRSLGLKPLEWDQAVALTGEGSPYVGQVLDAAFDYGQAVIVLLTPDDVAYLRSEYAENEDDPELKPLGQARPNVLFEAGMAMGRSPKRTIMVQLGDLRPFSDVLGRHSIRMNDSAEKRKSLAERLVTAECSVDMSGTDWLSAGNFTPPAPPGGGAPLGRRIPTQDRHGAHVDGRYHNLGSGKFDQIKVTNNGGEDVFDVAFEVPDDLQRHIQLTDAEPLPRLPVGKTFTRRLWNSNKTMGGHGPDQMEIFVIGRLNDQTPFRQSIFLDTIG